MLARPGRRGSLHLAVTMRPRGAHVQSLEGVITLAQESRFQITDRLGVSHQVVLSPRALLEPDQLVGLVRSGARVRVGFQTTGEVISLIARSVHVLEG